VPIERPVWRPTDVWNRVNQQLTRLMDVLALSDRYGVEVVSTTQALAVTYPRTVVLASTPANVTLTLPDPRTVPGFRVEIKKQTSANTLTVASAFLIDGAPSLAWSTQYQSYSVVSTGATWAVVTAPGTGGGGGGGGGGGVTDGDKGDVVVSGSGATWTLDADVRTRVGAANVTISPAEYGHATATITDARATTAHRCLIAVTPNADFDADDLNDVVVTAECGSGTIAVTLSSPILVGTYALTYLLTTP
jgi:hypothetical protein